jgi:hypothetical protein
MADGNGRAVAGVRNRSRPADASRHRCSPEGVLERR